MVRIRQSDAHNVTSGENVMIYEPVADWHRQKIQSYNLIRE